jgi:hypothetical protein
MKRIWLEIFIKNARSVHVCNIYKLPITSKHLHPHFETVFEDMINISMCENRDHFSWRHECRLSKQLKDKNIKRMISTNGLKQLIEKQLG